MAGDMLIEFGKHCLEVGVVEVTATINAAPGGQHIVVFLMAA